MHEEFVEVPFRREGREVPQHGLSVKWIDGDTIRVGDAESGVEMSFSVSPALSMPEYDRMMNSVRRSGRSAQPLVLHPPPEYYVAHPTKKAGDNVIDGDVTPELVRELFGISLELYSRMRTYAQRQLFTAMQKNLAKARKKH